MCVEMLSRLFLIATIIVTLIVVTNIVVTFIIVTIDEKCVFGARSLVKSCIVRHPTKKMILSGARSLLEVKGAFPPAANPP